MKKKIILLNTTIMITIMHLKVSTIFLVLITFIITNAPTKQIMENYLKISFRTKCKN